METAYYITGPNGEPLKVSLSVPIVPDVGGGESEGMAASPDPNVQLAASSPQETQVQQGPTDVVPSPDSSRCVVYLYLIQIQVLYSHRYVSFPSTVV